MNQNLTEQFKRLNIAFQLYHHQPVRTVADAQQIELPDGVLTVKNLFLHNQNKSKYYLFSMPTTTRIPLAELATITGDKRLSFASEKDLQAKLGVDPGTVSILNAINDDEHAVKYYVFDDVIDHHQVAYHPNQNDETIVFDGAAIPSILAKQHFYRFN